ncbi:MAG: aromatic ring-hydroxylating dioxygenase subunit alpha [Pseudomonadota bacterium]
MTDYAEMIRSVKSYVQLPFVHEHWYVAGTREEFGRKPVARTLLNESIVFFRTESGELSAMQNRCLHRSFPLSEAIVNGDRLVCRYHGIQYEADGSIARIPCQSQVSKKRLRTYPLREIGPFVFIWMGDSENTADFPDLSFFEDAHYRTIGDYMKLKGNYLLLMENLNDLTHFAYLHKETFRFDDGFFDLPTEIKEIDGRIWCNRIDRNPESALAALPPDIQALAAGKPVERWDGGSNVTPGIFQGSAPIYIGAEDDPDRLVFNQQILHYATPETETTSHYWWSMSLDFEIENDMMYEMLKAHLGQGFDEDKWAVEHMQTLLLEDHIDFKEMIIAGDKAGLLYRKVMLDWVRAEHGDLPMRDSKDQQQRTAAV